MGLRYDGTYFCGEAASDDVAREVLLVFFNDPRNFPKQIVFEVWTSLSTPASMVGTEPPAKFRIDVDAARPKDGWPDR